MLYCATVDPILVGGLIGGLIGIVIVLILIPIMKSAGKSVKRFSQVVPYLGDVAAMTARIEELLNSQGYFLLDYKGEAGVYKKGTGLATAKKFIKVEGNQGGFLIEAFVSIYGTESGLEGFTASIPKSSCKKTVNKVISLIQNR